MAVDEDSNDWRQLVEEAGAQGDYLAVEVEKYPLDTVKLTGDVYIKI